MNLWDYFCLEMDTFQGLLPKPLSLKTSSFIKGIVLGYMLDGMWILLRGSCAKMTDFSRIVWDLILSAG